MKTLGLFVAACLLTAGGAYLALRPSGHKEADANRVRHTLKVVRSHAKATVNGFRSYLTRVFDTHKPAEDIGFRTVA